MTTPADRSSAEDAPETGDLLRGPAGGFARSHRGLAAFHEDVAREVAGGPPGDDEAALFADLGEWLAIGGPRALLRGPSTAEHRRLLARWALSLARDGAAEVVYLPIDRAFGTAVERDALKLLFGQFPDASPAVFGRPRSPEELKLALRLALQGVSMVSSIPTEEAPHLVMILDGIDRAVDGWPDPESPFLAELGEGAHVLVTTGAGDPSWGALRTCELLGWSVEETAVFEPALFEAPPPEAGRPGRGEISGVLGIQAIRALDALSAALAPVSSADLVAALGVSEDEVAALSGDAVSRSGLVMRRGDGDFCFRDDAARAAWADPARVTELEDAVVQRGLGLLRSGVDPATWSPYLVLHLGAHVERRSKDPAARIALVSPSWLDVWMRRSGGLLGFVTDVRRARRAAEGALIAACAAEGTSDDHSRAALLGAVIRCALVEGSLFAKERSREEDAYRTAPFVDSGVDLSQPTCAARARAEVLCTLAARLKGADQERVGSLLAAMGDVAEGAAPLSVPEVLTAESDVDPERGRLLREGRTHDSMDGYLSRDLRIRGSGLGAEDAYRLASSREGEARMIAFAGILPDLPEERRRDAVREVVRSYSMYGDRLALRVLAACAPWMARDDAARIVCRALGNDWTETLAGMLSGFGGLAEMSPLLQRIGGSPGLVATAEEIAAVGRWLP